MEIHFLLFKPIYGCVGKYFNHSYILLSILLIHEKILMFILQSAEEGEDSQEKEGRSYGSRMIQRLTGSEEGRIDHMLQVRCFTNLMLNLKTMYMVMHMHILILHIYL